MRTAVLFAAMLASSRVFAGPIGEGDPHAAAPTGFPGAFLETFSLSLADDSRYGSRFLDAFDEHLQAVGVMTGPREVQDYLEQSAGGSEGVSSLRASLGRETLDPVKAAALLLADALIRPEQFRQVKYGLESLKHGVGVHASELLLGTRGTGDKKLFAAMRMAGKPRRDKVEIPYLDGGKLGRLFDLQSTEGRDGIALDEPAPDAVPAAKPRAADQAPPERR